MPCPAGEEKCFRFGLRLDLAKGATFGCGFTQEAAGNPVVHFGALLCKF
jgi:hypothetical protein